MYVNKILSQRKAIYNASCQRVQEGGMACSGFSMQGCYRMFVGTDKWTQGPAGLLGCIHQLKGSTCIARRSNMAGSVSLAPGSERSQARQRRMGAGT